MAQGRDHSADRRTESPLTSQRVSHCVNYLSRPCSWVALLIWLTRKLVLQNTAAEHDTLEHIPHLTPSTIIPLLQVPLPRPQCRPHQSGFWSKAVPFHGRQSTPVCRPGSHDGYCRGEREEERRGRSGEGKEEEVKEREEEGEVRRNISNSFRGTLSWSYYTMQMCW